MEVISFTEARASLKAVMDKAVDDREPVIITRRGGEPVVMIALSEWNSMEATEHLLSNPHNAAHLRASIAELDAGKGSERKLLRA